MKTRYILIAFLFLVFSENTFSQNSRTFPAIVSKDDHLPQARKIINTIMGVVGLEANFEILPARIPNAAAVTYAGKRFIVYNPVFMAKIDRAAGRSWASIAILAHEIGHHLIGHTLERSVNQHRSELQADEFSGYVLRKMGASLEDAQIAIKLAGSENASHTHPAKSDRLQSIAKGWSKAESQLTGRESIAVTDVMPSEKPISPVITLAEKFIAFDVHFATEPDSKYYVTTRNNFVRLQGDKLLIIGKLTETGKSSFPLVLFNGNHQVFLINPKGEIYTDTGRKIGWLNHRT